MRVSVDLRFLETLDQNEMRKMRYNLKKYRHLKKCYDKNPNSIYIRDSLAKIMKKLKNRYTIIPEDKEH